MMPISVEKYAPSRYIFWVVIDFIKKQMFDLSLFLSSWKLYVLYCVIKFHLQWGLNNDELIG